MKTKRAKTRPEPAGRKKKKRRDHVATYSNITFVVTGGSRSSRSTKKKFLKVYV